MLFRSDELLEVRKGTCDIYQLVIRKVNLLLEQNEEQKADDTIRQYLYLTEIRRMEVDKLIARCQYDEAICLLNDGIEIGIVSKSQEVSIILPSATENIYLKIVFIFFFLY